MNFSTDRAITHIEEDLLGRAPFSQQLGHAIYDYNGTDSLVIGLYGKWGTGKTSIANLAIETIERLSKDDDNKPIIIKFDPWNYSDKDNLIVQFFSSLKAKLNLKDDEKLKKLGKALNDYSGLFDFASLIPVVGSQIASSLKNIANTKGRELSASIDLDTSKETLRKELNEANIRIIVLIDDIDRLTNPQIRDIFQLVKQVGDLPNIIYLLAMEREVVRSALSEIHNADGNEYLEKIIQIPFEIPELSTAKLHEHFLRELDAVIKKLSIDSVC